MPAAAVQELCWNAQADGVSKFSLAPRHAILAVGASAGFAAQAQALGFVTTSSDPRLRVSACAGSEGCASGYIPARLLAARLAPLVRPGTHLHVSGCSKGCAHPRRADTAFVGLPDGLGLVIDGSAGDSPRALLQAGQLESALAAR
jgi:precorrin-3B synthase